MSNGKNIVKAFAIATASGVFGFISLIYTIGWWLFDWDFPKWGWIITSILLAISLLIVWFEYWKEYRYYKQFQNKHKRRK